MDNLDMNKSDMDNLDMNKSDNFGKDNKKNKIGKDNKKNKIGKYNFDNFGKDNKKNKKNKKSNFSSTEDIDMSNETNFDPKIKLKCQTDENKLINKGVCKKVCDFPNFKLKRLQHFEPKVFNFKPKSKEKPYSRICPDSRRPVVMSYDPNINPAIDKKSYTYSLKYKTNDKKEYNYICPKAWCPICEIPILIDKVTDIVYNKNKNCEYGKCPNGNHQVFINRKGIDEIYPGLLNPVGNPNGLCMPCCFIKDKTSTSLYKKCTSQDENNLNIKDIKKYISRREKIPLEEGRFGLIPTEIEVFLGQSKSCESGIIKNGFDCFVRKGIIISDKKDIFLNILLDLISEYDKPITKKEFINKIISKLDETLFNSLSSGLLKRMFKTLETYINFLLEENSIIKDIYIWDICSRPGIFVKEGINIIIFTNHSILCPFGQDVNNIYSLDRLTFLVYKFGDIYEPIYKVKYNNILNVTYLHNSAEPVINKIITYATKECKTYDEIDWDKAGKIEKTEEINLNETLEKLNKKFSIKLQFIDNYSKVSAILLDNNLYVPIKPSSINVEFPYITKDKDTDISLLSFDNTIQKIADVTKKTNLQIQPNFLVEFNSKIVGILLKTNRIIPIIPISLSKIKTKLKISNQLYYPDVNSENIDESYKEKRIFTINEYEYNNESFSRFKYEISKYLQTIKGLSLKNELIDIIEKPNDLNKHLKIKKIVNLLYKILVLTSSHSRKKIEKIIKSKDIYISPLLHTPCFELSKKEEQNPHCICDQKECKLVKLKKNVIDKTVDILLRYPIQRDDILNGTLSMIDLKTSLDKIQSGEILLSGNKIDDNFSKLFNDKDLFYLHVLKDIDFQQPLFQGIDKKSYLKIKKGTETNIKIYSIVQISPYWKLISNPSFRYVIYNEPCDSLYYIFSEISNKIINKDYKKRISNIQDINMSNIKEIYSNFILNMNISEIKNISKNILPDIPLDDIIDISDIYNFYNEKNKILSVDDLTNRIKIGYTTYKNNKLDIILLAYMFNINIVLLRTSVAEWIGKNIVDNNLYIVIYYEPYENENCISFYSLQMKSEIYITELNKIIKKLLK